MKKLLVLLFAALFAMGSSAGLVAAQDSTPAADEAPSSSDVNPTNPQIGDTITYYADNGSEAGTITVTDVERQWDGYDEYQEPDSGVEYVAVTFEVESLTSRGGLELSPYDFFVIDGQGYVHSTAYASNEESEDDVQVLSDSTSVQKGDTLEFVLVFEVYEDQPLSNVVWQPDSSIFLILADVSGEE